MITIRRDPSETPLSKVHLIFNFYGNKEAIFIVVDDEKSLTAATSLCSTTA